jgi:Zn-dependent peptidase ImmA (M78 family)
MATDRIPRTVRLPFDYHVKVRQVTRKEIRLRVGDDCVAGWVAADRTIYLIRSRSLRDKRADLAHELGHVMVDFAELYR